MKLKTIFGLFSLIVFLSNPAYGATKNDNVTKFSEKSIKEIVEICYPRNLYVGMATQEKLIGKLSVEIADREFGYITPANDFKQSYIHPEPGKWQWIRPENYLNHAAEKGQALRVHGPVSPQCSHWAREDQRTPEELSVMLEEYFTALCRRIASSPQVRWMDVVNETICKNRLSCKKYGIYNAGDWFGPRQGNKSWENPWLAIGTEEFEGEQYPVYIRRAFEISNRLAPNIKQIINQDSKLAPTFAEWEKMKKLVCYLRAKGLRVDGIGWQAHIDTGLEKDPRKLAYLNDFIDWCHKNGLEFHITEMNVWINEGDDEEKQAATFKAVFDTILPHVSQGPIGLCFWNVRDEDTDKADRKGTLWRNDGTPRPAYFALKDALVRNANK